MQSFPGLGFLFQGADLVRFGCGDVRGVTGGLCEGTEIPMFLGIFTCDACSTGRCGPGKTFFMYLDLYFWKTTSPDVLDYPSWRMQYEGRGCTLLG